MSRCDRSALAELVIDGLAPGERSRLELHLATCAACARELAELREERAWLEGRDLPPAPLERMFREVEARLRAPEPKRPRWRVPTGVLQFAAGAAVMVLAVMAPRAARTERSRLDGSSLICAVTPPASLASAEAGFSVCPLDGTDTSPNRVNACF